MSSVFAVVIGALVGVLLFVIFSYVSSRRPKQAETLDFEAGLIAPKTSKVHMFCRDCGKGMISLRSQDGFNTKTGEPVYSYVRVCAAASVSAPAWPFCGIRTMQSPMANAHNHPDPTGTSLSCPVCLDVMTQNAGIDQKSAIELYLKTGVISTQPSSDWSGGSLSRLFTSRGLLTPPPASPPTPRRKNPTSPAS